MKRRELEVLPAVAAFQGIFRVAISVGDRDPSLAQFSPYATVTVQTGAAHVQTYMTPDEMRKLASNLLDAAVDLQKQINAQEPPKSQNKRFTFYVEGAGIDVSVVAETEKAAYQLAWASLTERQKDACVGLDCVDAAEVAA
jgi:hypothetical protein